MFFLTAPDIMSLLCQYIEVINVILMVTGSQLNISISLDIVTFIRHSGMIGQKRNPEMKNTKTSLRYITWNSGHSNTSILNTTSTLEFYASPFVLSVYSLRISNLYLQSNKYKTSPAMIFAFYYPWWHNYAISDITKCTHEWHMIATYLHLPGVSGIIIFWTKSFN